MSPRLRPEVATATTEDGLVLLDERTGRYWQLNRTGADVLHALRGGRTPERIADELAARYGIEARRARDDVTAVIDQLTRANLLRRR